MTPQLAHVGPEAGNSLLNVTKAKVKNQLLYAEFTEQHDAEAAPRAFTMQATELIHPDLTRALQHLVPHLCLLTEQLTEGADYWPEEEDEEWPPCFAPYTVTGFSMGRNGAGVTLVGQRELAGSKVLNLVSPYTAFEDENGTYAYAGLLDNAVYEVLAEVEAALRGKADRPQLSLFTEPAPALMTEVLGEFDKAWQAAAQKLGVGQ